MPGCLAVDGRLHCSMSCRDAALAMAIDHGMDGDDCALLKDPDFVGRAVYFDRAATGRVGHAVEIAVNRDHAVLGDAALQAQHRLERSGGQRLEAGALLGEVVTDDAMGGGVHPGIGDLVEPLAELSIEIIAVAEAAAEEEVLADIAERPLDLALGLGTIRLAGL